MSTTTSFDKGPYPSYNPSYTYPPDPWAIGESDNVRAGSPINGLGCSPFGYWVIVIAVILPSLSLLNFVESWIWFSGLMKRKSALRGETTSWVLITLLVLCLTRTASARTAEDQQILRQRWGSMTGGTRFKLWLRWGFRMSYPVELPGDPGTKLVGGGTGELSSIPPAEQQQVQVSGLPTQPDGQATLGNMEIHKCKYSQVLGVK